MHTPSALLPHQQQSHCQKVATMTFLLLPVTIVSLLPNSRVPGQAFEASTMRTPSALLSHQQQNHCQSKMKRP